MRLVAAAAAAEAEAAAAAMTAAGVGYRSASEAVRDRWRRVRQSMPLRFVTASSNCSSSSYVSPTASPPCGFPRTAALLSRPDTMRLPPDPQWSPDCLAHAAFRAVCVRSASSERDRTYSCAHVWAHGCDSPICPFTMIARSVGGWCRCEASRGRGDGMQAAGGREGRTCCCECCGF